MKHTLLKQIIRVFEDKSHFGLNKVKTRSEVNRTKKKLYKQKGTGGARHGAKSAPIFVGGGKAHGPKGVKRELVMPKVLRQKALKLALEEKTKAKLVKNIESLEKIKKTKDAYKMISSLKLTGKTLVVLNDKNAKYTKYFRNIENVKVLLLSNLNAYDVLVASNLLIEKGMKI